MDCVHLYSNQVLWSLPPCFGKLEQKTHTCTSAQLFMILVYLTHEQKANTWWIVSAEQHSFSKEGERGPAVDKYWLGTMLGWEDGTVQGTSSDPPLPAISILQRVFFSIPPFFFILSFFLYIWNFLYLFKMSSLLPFFIASLLHPEANPAQLSGCNPSLTILNNSYLCFSLWSDPLPALSRPLLSLYEHILRDPLWHPA